MSRIMQRLLLMAALALCTTAMAAPSAPSTAANGEPSVNGRTLTVAVRENPPFVIRDASGQYSGIAIELWNGIAAKLGVHTVYKPVSNVDDLLAGVADGRFDVGVDALTVTAARAETVDFTQPFFRGGVGIATRETGGWVDALEGLLSAEFFKTVGALLLVLLLVGVVVWLFERRRNPDQFGGGVARGIGSGLWWSAVTMTTVGYGDKAPVSVGGRVVGLVWMFVSVITISGFTAAIASSVTVGQLSTAVRGVADLSHVRVASVAGSTSAAFARSEGIEFVSEDDATIALRQLENHKVDAVVYDAPVLKALIHQSNAQGLTVLRELVRDEDYALAVGRQSGLRRPVSQALLSFIEAPGWQQILDRYLGPNH
jgi:ABC-type amino acid transport substrate-binding protein